MKIAYTLNICLVIGLSICLQSCKKDGSLTSSGVDIIAPTGEIIAKCNTLGDELIFAECDLDRCKEIKENIFNFSLHREPENYTIISSPKKDATK